jgi:cytochrome c oxidase cbb3-type subunit 3
MLAIALVAGCEREERDTRAPPSTDRSTPPIQMSELHPGGPLPPPPVPQEYEISSYHVSQGQQLFSAFNCVGCHSHGGGGMGPPLIDDSWIYGSQPQNIFATIIEGRPNGMPSFRGKIPEQQVWELVAYVRALGGFARFDVPSARTDELTAYPSPTSLPEASPKASGPGPSNLGTNP